MVPEGGGVGGTAPVKEDGVWGMESLLLVNLSSASMELGLEWWRAGGGLFLREVQIFLWKFGEVDGGGGLSMTSMLSKIEWIFRNNSKTNSPFTTFLWKTFCNLYHFHNIMWWP